MSELDHFELPEDLQNLPDSARKRLRGIAAQDALDPTWAPGTGTHIVNALSDRERRRWEAEEYYVRTRGGRGAARNRVIPRNPTDLR